MKKGFRKIGAVLLTIAMALAMNSTVFAAPDGTLDGGLDGDFTADAWAVDTNETVNIQKELISDNAGDVSVKAPTINYNYEITAGTAGKTIKDATTAHTSGASVTATTKAGVTAGLKVNNTSGTTGSISWAPDTDDLTEGSNVKNLVLNFSGVNFGAAGVYRYVITEKPEGETVAADIDAAYLAAGVKGTTGSHVRYLDVYVKPSANYTGTGAANDWDVYGYVCFSNDNSIDATDTSSAEPSVDAAAKTNGFVTGSSAADTYYTFNVTISKTVTGDTLLQNTHAEFPFFVKFENASVTQPVLPIVSTSTNYSTIVTPLTTSANINSLTNHDLTIGHEGSVTYTGIPSGTKVSVYETVSATGTAGSTYTVTTTGADTNLDEVVANPNSSTSAVLNAQTVQAENNNATIAFTNALLLISPTGFVVRFAPYMLVLLGGILLIAIGLLVYNKTNKKETA